MQHMQYQLINSIWAHRCQIHTLVYLAPGGGPSTAWKPATTATSMVHISGFQLKSQQLGRIPDCYKYYDSATLRIKWAFTG